MMTEINENMSFEEMLDASFKRLRAGETTKGIVTSVTPTEVHLDLGVKYTGIIPHSEMTMDASQKLEDIVKVGDEIEAIVIKPNDAEGTITLSKVKIDAVKCFDEIEAAEANDEILTGKVVEITRGGIAVLAKGVRVFIPISQTTLPRREEAYEEKDLQVFAGKEVSFKIISVEKARKRVVGSMRAAARVEREAAEAKFWETVEEGQKFTGKVKSITNYGAFVDLGGVDGMVHVSELSWKRIKNPSEVVKVGEEIDVFVKALDKENKRISLGHKVDAENPWTILSEKYNEGDVVEAKVAGLTPFGAFAEIIPGIDGLIHISQISNKKIAKPADELSVGDVVTAKITAIDYDAKRVSLSMRALLEPEEEVVEEAAEEAVEAVEEVAEVAAEEAAE
ncbi:MAG: S1 RNA-binding domain-containing protein [Clostridia bacterium]|nr:S1 RNA-binding domain-containing protein [Clostridia bacterium]